MSARMGSRAGLAGLATLAILAGSVRAQALQPPATATTAVTVSQNSPVAVVDGQVITLADVEGVLKDRGPLPVQLPEEKRRQMRLEMLGLMIDDILLQKHLRQNGPRIDPAEVNQRLADLEEALKKQGKTLQDFYRESGQSEADIRNAQTLMLQWTAYVKSRLDDEALKRYHAGNRDFFDGTMVRASHIVFQTPPGTTEADLKAIRDRLLALRAQLIAGKLDFAQAAMKNSQCDSASRGGDIGTFPRKFVVDEVFARTAFALPVGQVSDIVQTNYGLHLIKVLERHPGQPSDLQKIKEAVRDVAAEELRQALLADLRRAAKVQINLP